MIDFPDHFLFFSFFFCTLKYANMIRISNISFFRFCWKNGKLDWPKCARAQKACFLLLLLLLLFLFSFFSFYYKVNVDLFLKTRDYNIRVLWRREMSAFFLMLFFAYKYRVEILSLLHAWHFLAYLSLYAGVLKSQWNLQGKITCRIIQKI